MGLFSKKKQGETQTFSSEQQDLQEFPDIPEMADDSEDFQFSTYEPAIADIKNQVSNEEVIQERKQKVKPVMAKPDSNTTQLFSEAEKPVFVRMDSYKEALKHLKALNEKIESAQGILVELESIREEEEKKIDEWKQELNNIKERMLSIDKQLFEE